MDELIKFSIDRSEIEIKDLKKYWGDLSWYERDQSINAAITIPDISHIDISDVERGRIDSIVKECYELSNLNERPSKFKLLFGLIPDESWKPNYGICAHILPEFSSDELIDLGRYLDLDEIESFNGSKYDLIELYLDLELKSSAMFYAIRNYVGKKIR